MTEPRPRRIPLAAAGVEIALLDWGGDGPLVLLHHANGFCAGTLGLVAEALAPRYRVIGMDARGHGRSSKPEGPSAYAWERFAEDLLAVAEALAAERSDGRVDVALGHSFGGTAVLGAAARRPSLFGRLVLVDPVVPDPDDTAGDDPERATRIARLVEGARRRRSRWSSRAEARAHFAERALFAGWQPRALDLYVEHGLVEHPGGEVELRCPGEVEAAVFAHGTRGVDALGLAARADVPATWLWAARDSFSRRLHERTAAAMPRARFVPVDAGHLVPMEQPELVVRAVVQGEEDRWASTTT